MKKKIIAALLVSACLLSACSKTDASDGTSATIDSNFKTVGDVLAVTEGPSLWTDESFIYSFILDGKPYQIKADMTPETNAEIDELFNTDLPENVTISDEIDRVVSGLEITELIDLSPYALDQATIDSLKGQTGQYFLDNGYEIGSYNVLEEPFVEVSNDHFAYTIKINETYPGEDYDDEAIKQFFGTATISEITLSGFGYSPETIVPEG